MNSLQHRLEIRPLDRRRLGNGRRRARFLGLVSVFLLTAFGAPAVGHAVTFNYSGTIDANSPSYQRTGTTCASSLGPTRFYQAQPFTVDQNGSYILKNESNTFTPNDPGDSYFALYTGTFTPGSPMTNCTAVNDDDGADIKSKITASLVTGTTYILVTTPFGNSTGNFANSITGPGTASGPATPTVTTPTATAIADTTATLGGNVTSDGNVAITARGVVYSQTTTNNLPAIGGTGVTQAGTTGTTGVFTVGVSGLSAGVGHSYRAYATNSLGTSYSPVGTFTTTGGTAPTFTSVNANSFVLGQNATFTVTATGGPLPALSHTSGTLPNGITFTNIPNTGTATLGGTPAAGTAGNYNLVFTASNASGSPTQNFTLTVVASANTANYSGTIDANSPSYQRTGGSGSGASCAIAGPTRPYQAQPFIVDRNGSYVLKNVSNTFVSFDSGDSYFALYTGTFIPGSPMTNCTVANDDDGADIKSKITANLVTGTAYILVTTPFGNSTGNFANSITGPGTVTFPPTVSDISKSGNEDTQITFTAANFDAGFSDSTGDVLATVRVTSLPANGTLKLSGVNVTVNQDIPRAQLGNLTFDPASNFNGPTSFGWNGSDGTNFAPSAALVNITITAVNDAPTLNAIANPAAILEDAGAQTVNLSGIGAGGGESQTLTITATSGNPGLIPDPTVTYTSPNATGSLSYTPVANQSGSALITVTVKDNGGTANGGVDTTTRTFTVNVTAVNDAPTLAAIANPAAILEDAGLQTVNLSGISAGGGESQTLTVTATSGNPGLIPDPTVTYTSPNATGALSYTPVANQSGSALITVTVKDNGGTANGGVDTTTRTFTVNVTAVNDAPTLAAIANPAAILENAGAQTVNLSGIGAGGGESQTLTVTATSGNPGLIPDPTVTYTSPSATGALSYEPVANQSGSAVITVTVKDNGGTANGGVDTTTRTFTVNVTASPGDNIGVFRGDEPSGSNTFFLRNANTLAPPAHTIAGVGAPGDQPLMGDWNGDGLVTLGLVRPNVPAGSNTVFLWNANVLGPPDVVIDGVGAVGDKFFVGDWDGNGTDTLAILRPNSPDGSNTIFYWNTLTTPPPAPDGEIFGIGAVGDLPIAGKWNGSGASSIALMRPNEPAGLNSFFIWLALPTTPDAPDVTIYGIGAVGDLPLAGNWDGDANATDTIGLFRANEPAGTTTFFLWNSINLTVPLPAPDVEVEGYGAPTDLPVTGHF